MTSTERIRDACGVNTLSFLWLEITGRCNLFCTHCYADSGPASDLCGDMTHADWTRILDEAAEFGCRRVQFIGGEPTLHPHLDDLVDHANHRGFEFIEVFTNATRLGTELLGCFRRNGVHVAASFYSENPAVHERITQGKGSWQRTVRGIRSVLDAGLPIRVGVIETEWNVGHASRAVAFLTALGVREVRVDRQRGVGRGGLLRLGSSGERYDELCGECWKGRLCVTCGGETFPCVFSRATPLGDARCGLGEAMRSAPLSEFRAKVRALQEARACVPDCAPAGCAPAGCAPGGCPPTGLCEPSSTCTPTCNPPCAPASCGPN